MKSRHDQKGMSMIGWVIVIGFAGLVALVAIRLFPVYMEYYTISSIMDDLTHEPATESVHQVRDSIDKRFDINDVSVIQSKDIQFAVKDGKTSATVHYEARVPFIANLSLVATFDKTVQVGSAN